MDLLLLIARTKRRLQTMCAIRYLLRQTDLRICIVYVHNIIKREEMLFILEEVG